MNQPEPLAEGSRHDIVAGSHYAFIVRVFSAKVHGGSIVTDGEVDLPDGATVTVVVDEDEKGFDLTPEEEDRLAEAIEQADRGEVVSAAELLRRLAR